MITIHFIVLGKLKELYWQAAEAEYLKRLQPWVKIVIHELKEEAFTEKIQKEMIKKKEAEKIKNTLEKIKNAFLIILDEKEKQYTSLEFSKKISTIQQTNSTIVFVIGGPLGLDTEILKLAHLKFSLSSLTFTHQMARIILLEQLYRAYTIALGKKYHY